MTSTVFPAPIYTKLTDDNQHYMQTSYSEFHEKWKGGVEIHFPPVKCEFHCADFHETHKHLVHYDHLMRRISSKSDEKRGEKNKLSLCP
jgi:hypothetical protein